MLPTHEFPTEQFYENDASLSGYTGSVRVRGSSSSVRSQVGVATLRLRMLQR